MNILLINNNQTRSSYLPIIVVCKSFLLISLFFIGTAIEANALCRAPTIEEIQGEWRGDDGTTSTFIQTEDYIEQFGQVSDSFNMLDFHFIGTLMGSDTEGYTIEGTFQIPKYGGGILE